MIFISHNCSITEYWWKVFIETVFLDWSQIFNTRITTQTCTICREVWHLPHKLHLLLNFYYLLKFVMSLSYGQISSGSSFFSFYAFFLYWSVFFCCSVVCWANCWRMFQSNWHKFWKLLIVPWQRFKLLMQVLNHSRCYSIPDSKGSIRNWTTSTWVITNPR